MTDPEIVKTIMQDADRLFTEAGAHPGHGQVDWDTDDGLMVLVSHPMMADLVKHLNSMSRSSWEISGGRLQLTFQLHGGRAPVVGIPHTLCNTVVVDRPRLVTGPRFRTQIAIRDLVLADLDLARHLYKEAPKTPAVWFDQSDPDGADLSTMLLADELRITRTNIVPPGLRALLWYSEFGLHQPEAWKPKERTPADVERDELRSIMEERRKRKGDC